jgi:hypothetical protein
VSDRLQRNLVAPWCFQVPPEVKRRVGSRRQQECSLVETNSVPNKKRPQQRADFASGLCEVNVNTSIFLNKTSSMFMRGKLRRSMSSGGGQVQVRLNGQRSKR